MTSEGNEEEEARRHERRGHNSPRYRCTAGSGPGWGSTCILGHAASIRREVLELADGGRYRVAMPSASPFAGPEWKEMDSREPVDTSAHDAPAHHMVGAGGFEPPTSSVSRKARETL